MDAIDIIMIVFLAGVIVVTAIGFYRYNQTDKNE